MTDPAKPMPRFVIAAVFAALVSGMFVLLGVLSGSLLLFAFAGAFALVSGFLAFAAGDPPS